MNARRRLATCVAAALCCLAIPAAASADSADVTEAVVNLRLAPDAALLVDEQLTFDYEGSYHASYRDILLKKGETVTDISVREGKQQYRDGACTVQGCTDQTGKFGVTSIAGGIRIVWHHNASNQERTFNVAYRVEDGVVAYDNLIDVEWQVWGDQWDFDLEHLTATFTDPALRPVEKTEANPTGEATPENPSGVWGKPREVEGADFLEPGVARLEASDVRDGQFVAMRVIVPRTKNQGVSEARIAEGDGLQKILDEEQGIDDDYNSFFNKTKRWLADNAILLSMILAGIGLLGLFLFARMATEHPTSVPKHVPEPPDDASPALAYGLAHEGSDSTDTVLATLLDLVDRGYYTAKQETTDDEKLDLALSVKEKRPTAKLEPHETQVLGFFDQLLEGETVAISKMKDKIPEHSDTWRTRWEGMAAALNSVDEGQLSWDRNMNGPRWLLILGLAIGFGVIVLADINVNEAFFLPSLIGVLTLITLAVYPWNRLKRLSPEYAERSAKWRGFERWTRDFPSLKDDPPATLELWKRILVFGVAFGTAERMIKSGRIPAPVLESSNAGWSTYYFSGGVSDTSFDGGDFGSGFSSQVAPESSSSGGGGGFSGGGGGASGGGGGGSW